MLFELLTNVMGWVVRRRSVGRAHRDGSCNKFLAVEYPGTRCVAGSVRGFDIVDLGSGSCKFIPPVRLGPERL
jgi:hypothetical protein